MSDMRDAQSDRFFWNLCYSHYLYPAYLTIRQSRVHDAIERHGCPLALLARRCHLSIDAVIALLPALTYFDFARLTAEGNVYRPAATRNETMDDQWRRMIERHIESDRHFLRLYRLFKGPKVGLAEAFWRKTRRSVKSRRLFFESIDAHSVGTSVTIARQVEKQGVQTLVDLGGGYGTNSFAALDRVDDLKCFLVDHPEVIGDVADSPAFAAITSARLELTPGDLFNIQWPRAADTYLMSHLLQDYPRRGRRRLLVRAHRAMRPDSTLLIHGVFPSATKPCPVGAAFGFYLYCHLGGGVLDESAQVVECADAGFVLTQVVRTSSIHKLLFFEKRTR